MIRNYTCKGLDMDNKRVYGQIGLGRLLDIVVYLGYELVYEGMIEDEIKRL